MCANGTQTSTASRVINRIIVRIADNVADARLTLYPNGKVRSTYGWLSLPESCGTATLTFVLALLPELSRQVTVAS